MPREHQNHLLAIQQANIMPGEKVLEVALGPGHTFLELAKKIGSDTRIYGVDLSTRMMQLTEKALQEQGYAKIDLREADCRELPFADCAALS